MAGFLVGIGKAGEVAERSPAVISANLKEDMLLQKKRLVLDRSARNLVHQIKVDQKVVYKNFQSKLVRSKLAFARLMGQKDIEKDLRAKNLGGLNTDIVGSADEEYAFLEKLEQRPCTASSVSPRIVAPGHRKQKLAKFGREFSCSNSNQDTVIKKPTEGLMDRPSSAVAGVTNIPGGAVGTKLHEMRPATTSGIRVDKDFIRHQNQGIGSLSPTSSEGSAQEIQKEMHDHITDSVNAENTIDAQDRENITGKISDTKDDSQGPLKEKEKVNDATNGEDDNKVITNDSRPTVAFLEELELNLDKLQRPRTVAITGLSDFSGSPLISPKHISRRASRASDFFQEEKKIDLVQLRLQAARAVDFTDKVNKFCESLEMTQDSRNKPTSDYYTIRLEASMKERAGSEIVNVPGTPDDENKRAMGNIFVRSLTVPNIDWNFV